MWSGFSEGILAVNMVVLYLFTFYTLPHNSGGVLWFHVGCPCVRPSVVRPSVFLFLDNNLSKYEWIFTKLGNCIDNMEIWFGISNGKITSVFNSYLPAIHPYFCFRTITSVNINGYSRNLICVFILWRSGLKLLIADFVNFCQSYLPATCPYFRFQMITFVNLNGFSLNLICGLILRRSGLDC